MVIVFMRICYLCELEGELEPATHSYKAHSDTYDICESCAIKVRNDGFTVWILAINDVTELEIMHEKAVNLA